MSIQIYFSRAWGEDSIRWNYCGGDYNFKSLAGFMKFYGISKVWKTGEIETYYYKNREIDCWVYSGIATKELERLKKHWKI